MGDDSRGDVTTKELFDMYFGSLDAERARKTRSQVDRQEVYDYEEAIDKRLVDMDVDELFDMISTFSIAGRAKSKIGFTSYDMIASTYRAVFEYYIEHVRPIKNPFADRRMRGIEAAGRLVDVEEVFDREKLGELIQKVHECFYEDRADYYECVMLLFYNGFARPEEIVMLDEGMLMRRERIIRLPGRMVWLSDRCFELLEQVHRMASITGARRDFDMVSWHGKYFRYPVKGKNGARELQGKSVARVGRILSTQVSQRVGLKCGVSIDYRKIYLLGFYDYLVEEYGEERTVQMVCSVRNSEDSVDLLEAARMYGMASENVTRIKMYLRPYVPRDMGGGDADADGSDTDGGEGWDGE